MICKKLLKTGLFRKMGCCMSNTCRFKPKRGERIYFHGDRLFEVKEIRKSERTGHVLLYFVHDVTPFMMQEESGADLWRDDHAGKLHPIIMA